MEAGKKMVEKRLFEKIYNMTKISIYSKYGDFPEDKETFFEELSILKQKKRQIYNNQV